MSLDVHLDRRRSPEEVEELRKSFVAMQQEALREYMESIASEEIYQNNITHNLVEMAEAAGIYEACWRPESIGIKKASQLIEPLAKGLADLRSRPEYFRRFNPSNRWGNYERFVRFVSDYLDACKDHPDADVSASR